MAWKLAIVPHYHVMDVWMKVLPLIMKGEKHWKDFYSLNQIRRNLIEGTQQLFVIIEDETDIIACIISQIDQFPTKKIARIAYCGGRRLKPKMMPMVIGQIENWAKREGAVMIDILGRKGWGRLLPDYTIPGIVFRKELI